MRTDELNTCAEPPTWLARSQKIACTRTGCVTVREPSWWRKWRNKDSARTPKYTLALILICACVWSAALRWNRGQEGQDSPIIIGRLTIIIIIVLYINRRLSLISSWLSTKTFAIVDISDYRRYTILSSIGATLQHNLFWWTFYNIVLRKLLPKAPKCKNQW